MFRGKFVALFSYGSITAWCLLVIGIFAGLFHVFHHFRLPEAFIRGSIFFLLVISLFLAILATQSFNLYNSLFLRVMVGGGLFFASLLLLTIHTEKTFPWGRQGSVGVSAILCFIFITTDGYIHSLGVLADRADLLIASRMAARIESQSTSAKPLALVVIGLSQPFLGLPHLGGRGLRFLKSRPWLDAPLSSFTAGWAKRPIFHSIGHDFLLPSRGQLSTACALSRTMPVWPAQGSVLVKEDLSVIKLSQSVPADGCPPVLR